jgi:hypothetical protein
MNETKRNTYPQHNVFIPTFQSHHVNNKRRNIDVNKNKYKVISDSSTYTSSPELKNNLSLVVNVKLKDDTKLIYLMKSDNPAQIAEKFCKRNRIDKKLVRPITQAINRAINSIDEVLFSEIDRDISEIKEMYDDFMNSGDVSAISEFTEDDIEQDERLNKTI